jgi:aminopeptidase
LADQMLERMARTLVRYSLEVRPGDLLLVRTTTLAVPLVREVYREALEAGANVVCRFSFDGQEDLLYATASDEQLAWVSPADRLDAEQVTARLTINAPFNTRSGRPKATTGFAARTKALAELQRIGARRSASGEMRWCGTLFPTQALAQEADMSLMEYEKFVFDAMFLDQEYPIAAWQNFSKDQQRRVDRLDRAQTLRIVAEDTDLTMRVAGRKWMNSDGRRNFPSGEVFTGPVEDSVEGHIRFSFPSMRGGSEVQDVRLRFEEGRVVEATAARGQEALDRELGVDEGARYVGEIAVGNNYGIQRYTKNTLFDEKIGGTCHLALGSSYAETGGRNESAIHWDLVCDLRSGGEIYADGEIIHRNGKWVDG